MLIRPNRAQLLLVADKDVFCSVDIFDNLTHEVTAAQRVHRSAIGNQHVAGRFAIALLQNLGAFNLRSVLFRIRNRARSSVILPVGTLGRAGNRLPYPIGAGELALRDVRFILLIRGILACTIRCAQIALFRFGSALHPIGQFVVYRSYIVPARPYCRLIRYNLGIPPHYSLK